MNIRNTFKFLSRPGILTAAFLTAIGGLQAGTIVYEGFDIPVGEVDNTLGETSFGFLSVGGIVDFPWEGYEQQTVEPYHGIAEGSPPYDGVPTVGNSFVFTDEIFDFAGSGGFNSVTRRLQVKYNYYGSGQLWFSTLVTPKITGNGAGGGWFQVCLSNAQNDVYLGIANTNETTVWSGGGERMYVNEGDGPIQGQKWAYSEFPIEDGVTAFLVMHLDLDNKTAHFYVNPDPYATDPGTPVANFDLLTDLYIDKVRIWSLNAGPSVEGEGADYIGSQVDEIRVGDTYQSVANGADLTDPGGTVDETPPVITGPSGAAGDATSEASLVEYTVKAADMTANETVTWSISGGADGSFFTIGAGNGGLSFQHFPDFEMPADADMDNVYEVEVTATDSYDNASSQTVMVTVTDAPGWADFGPVADGWVDTNEYGGTFLGRINIENEPWIWIQSIKQYVYIHESRVDNDGVWGMLPLSVADTTPGDWAYWDADVNDTCLVDTGKSFLGPINVCLAPWVFSGATDYFIYLPQENVIPGKSWMYFVRIPGDPPAEE